jgi:hypothetical protein
VAAGAAVNVETIMDSLNSDGSGALALEPLCQAAAQELLMRSYTVRTLNRYKRVWEQLADFARAQGQPALYSRELALRFEEAFGLRDGEVLSKGQHWRRHLVFGIKVLDDFARTGTISRFVVETTGLRVPVGMHKALREYEQYARERRHLRPTSLAERMHTSRSSWTSCALAAWRRWTPCRPSTSAPSFRPGRTGSRGPSRASRPA